jgi:hypothetical protein
MSVAPMNVSIRRTLLVCLAVCATCFAARPVQAQDTAVTDEECHTAFDEPSTRPLCHHCLHMEGRTYFRADGPPVVPDQLLANSMAGSNHVCIYLASSAAGGAEVVPTDVMQAYSLVCEAHDGLPSLLYLAGGLFLGQCNDIPGL